jgi:uncharacterized membrane protein HdeD (DUF308 family)
MIFNRKSLALRGIIAVIFGLCAIIWTPVVLNVLIYAFGLFAIIAGILTAAAGISSEKTELPKWLLVIAGTLGILLGIFALLTPLIVAITLTLLIAAWALVTGATELGWAVTNKALKHRVLLFISGLCGITLAIILIIIPILGAFTIVLVLGIYLLVFGIISIAVGLSMGKETVTVATTVS